jgi:hypothetical protein
MRARGYGDGLIEAAQADLPEADRPVPLVPVTRIAGVQERVDYAGNVVLSVDEDDVRRQVRRLVGEGAQAFVVALANSVVNPVHEKEVERIVLDEYPTHMLGAIPVVLSHRVTGRKASTPAPCRRSSTPTCTTRCTTAWRRWRSSCAATALPNRCCWCTTRGAWRS